jgi:hypothetical protein
MPYVTLLGSLVMYEPERARAQIMAAVTETNGNLTNAATKLGVNHRTLCRWAGELGLGRDIELVRTAAGWADPRSHLGSLRPPAPLEEKESARPLNPRATAAVKRHARSIAPPKPKL